MRVVAAVVRYAHEAVVETLPQNDEQASAFVAGMAWGLVIYVLLLIGVSWLTVRAFGGTV
jgi:hypothetical protein